jgi:hypothetical protein
LQEQAVAVVQLLAMATAAVAAAQAALRLLQRLQLADLLPSQLEQAVLAVRLAVIMDQ